MHRLSVFDAHCDTISRCWRNCVGLAQNTGAISLCETSERFGCYSQVFALWTAEGYTGGNSVEDAYEALLRCFRREMEQNQGRIVQCRTGGDILRAHRQGMAAAILAIEGAELIGCSLGKLERAAADGVRIITLTWNHANGLSGSAQECPEQGLTALGRRFVRRMEELGILADVSHMSERGFWDVLEQANRPVIASHSNARAVWDRRRNLTDGQITAIIKNHGVIGLNFYRDFIGLGMDLHAVRAHLEHIWELNGQKHVALGGDWDGCETISSLSKIIDLGRLYEYLLQCNYPEMLLQDLFYNNLMRIVSES